MFEIVPVIDLKNGLVVRAKFGQRHLYAPIESPLAATSQPADVVAGLLDLHAFERIYIADLDAIESQGEQASDLAALEAQFPNVRFWIDAGIATRRQADTWLTRHSGDLVLGSENLTDSTLLADLRQSPRISLSLDFRGDMRQGPADLFEQAGLWPERIIVMTLGRVGSQAGPDLDQLAAVRAFGGERHRIYAAGGVRGRSDLEILRRIGVSGALIASALHDGHLAQADLQFDADL